VADFRFQFLLSFLSCRVTEGKLFAYLLKEEEDKKEETDER